MATALRQRLGPLLPALGSRSANRASTAVPSRRFAHSSAVDDVEEMHKWKRITALGLTGVVAFGIYTFSGNEHPEHHERPGYSYLHIRNKEFPWGPDGLFEYHHDE